VFIIWSNLIFLSNKTYALQGACQRFALPALGRAAGRRPIGKRLRRRKMLENGAESPASGARSVGKNWG